MKVDYLIIGQGLAGSLLAWELLQRKKTVFILDNNQTNASLIAAGLINPITGMRFVKSVEVDVLLPSAINYYSELSQFFNQSFYIEKMMFRLLRNDKELVACKKRFNNTEYSSYIAESTSSLPAYIENSIALLKQKKTGYLLTIPLLNALKEYFITRQAYQAVDLLYDEIKLTPELHWRDIQPKKIIFCEGYQATNNPWFSRLPFQLVKGEIITASTAQILPPNILNYGTWMIPLNEHDFRIGASFDRENIDTNPTTLAKKQLFNSLNRVYPSIDVKQITNHQAGIRPTTLDKMPFIGHHPIHPDLFIFNGFGSKGSLQIPWYCQKLADNLINNHSLPPRSNIQRYHALL